MALDEDIRMAYVHKPDRFGHDADHSYERKAHESDV
jgi:hypothetical protein